jgi:Flp pilus assembly protein TadG
MSRLRRLCRDQRASAAVEMVLVAPLMLGVMFGSVEVGNYFYDEHRLVKAVRDGARYAARQQFSNYSACSGQPTAPIPANAQLMTQKGSLDATAQDLLPNWASATFTISMSCTTTLDAGGGGTYNLGGIYANVGAPTVIVSVSIPYQSLFGTAFGVKTPGVTLNATQSAAVMGL